MSIKFREIVNKSWHNIFDKIDKEVYEYTENMYIEKVKDDKVYPHYNNIFSFTNYCKPKEIKVIIIGQDPYHQKVYNNKLEEFIPQATGLAFSVPKDCKIPPSLNNIYENLIKYNHIVNKPIHGNLEYWSKQGVLLLNTSLTVEESKPNSHQTIWQEFVNELLQILTINTTNIVFVFWGKNALNKYNLLKDNLIKNNHKYIISSHPSPLSVYKKLDKYEAFTNVDHFGIINEYLKENNKFIDWQIY